MEYSTRITYSRSSTDTAWLNLPQNIRDYIEINYDNTGKRLSHNDAKETGTLERVVTNVWKDKESFLEFLGDENIREWLTYSSEHRAGNDIKRSKVENTEGFFN